MRRGDVDDAAPFVGDHRGQREPRGVEGGGQIDGENRVPFRRREVLQRRNMLDAGIVDEDVEPAEFAQSRFDHLGDRGGARHVGAGIVDANVVILGDAFAGSFDLLRLAEAVQHYVRASAGERAGDAETDAAGRAGDERDFAFHRPRN